MDASAAVLPHEERFAGDATHHIEEIPPRRDESVAVVFAENEEDVSRIRAGGWRAVLPFYHIDIFMVGEFLKFHRPFYDFFHLDDFPIKHDGYEERAARILAMYETVNFCALDFSRLDLLMEALLTVRTSGRELTVFIPRGRVPAGICAYLAKRLCERTTVVTTEAERTFWGYFIKSHPAATRFSDDFGEWAVRRRQMEESGERSYEIRDDRDENAAPIEKERRPKRTYEPLSFTEEERSSGDARLRQMGIGGRYAVIFGGSRADISRLISERDAAAFLYDETKIAETLSEASGLLEKLGLQTVCLSFAGTPRVRGAINFLVDESYFSLYLISRAQFFACGHFAFGSLATLCRVPLLMFDSLSMTWDGAIAPRIDEQRSLMLPPKIVSAAFMRPLSNWELLELEECFQGFYERVDFLKEAGRAAHSYTPDEIREAINSGLYFLPHPYSLVESSAEDIVDSAMELLSPPPDDDTRQKCRTLLARSLLRNLRVFYDIPTPVSYIRKNPMQLGIMHAAKRAFSLGNILPHGLTRAKRRIKVRINYQSFATWNSYRTIAEACQSDDDIDFAIILPHGLKSKKSYWGDDEMRGKEGGRTHLSYNDWISNVRLPGYRYMFSEDYSAAWDAPDVFIRTGFFTGSGPEPALSDMRQHAKLIIFAVHSVIKQSGGFTSIEGFNEVSIEPVAKVFSPDYILVDSLVYGQMKTKPFCTEKYVNMGNAKYDGIYTARQKRDFPPGWEKLREKRVVLWTTDHGLYERWGVAPDISFDVYANTILTYMECHPEMGLIFRPHPTFLGDLAFFDFWSREDFARFRDYCVASPNVVFDERMTYEESFGLADAIIIDPYCGIMASALPTLSPICISYRGKNTGTSEPELAQNYYGVRSPAEMLSFLEMVRRGIDPMYAARKAAAQKYVKHFDGKNGWRIKEFVKEKWREKFGEK